MDPLKYIVPGRKRLPYGMMNFAVIRREDYYYVDKTRFIPMIEEADRFFFFIRPRRFGKSLTLNLLQHYYDVRTRDRFEDLFGDLYIGQHPTPSRNTYLVLYLNFSGITGELNNYRKGLDAHCGITFENFCKKYADLLPQGTPEGLCAVSGAVEQLDYLYQACERAGQKMYLFIDEYDHFTNAILADPESLHRYTNETHGEGYLRAFFNKVKAGTYSSIERCFITGVSPVTMDDLTSGFNIGTNYSLTPEFNQLMGFTEEEVREMLTYYSTTSPFHHTVDELIEIMKPWYDNYCFAQKSYGGTTMYNSNMVLYFVKNYILYGNAPDNMVEENIRIDYEKLRMLIRKDKEFAHDASVIQTLVSQGFITGELKTGFPASGITNPDNFVSLLYYFGMLTISGTHEGKTKLTIPNLVVQEQLYTYLLNTYNDADLSFSSYEKSELASLLRLHRRLPENLRLAARQAERRVLRSRFHSRHDRAEPLLPPRLRTGHAGGLRRHLPLPHAGHLLRHDAQLHRGAEICQIQRSRNPRGRIASGSHRPSQPLRRYRHGEARHRQHPPAQDCGGI